MSSTAVESADVKGGAPADAAAFVQEAERIANSYDAPAAAATYAEDALMETVTDGASDEARGRAAIERMWSLSFAAAKRSKMVIRKQLAAADGDTITNTWEGRIGRARTVGAEVWRFDADGLVTEHQMFTYLNVNSRRHPIQSVRVLMSSPRMAIGFLLAEIKQR